MRRGATLLAALSWLTVAACEVITDPDELKQGCVAGSKACELEPGELGCVSASDPEYGCGRDSCVPCTLPHAEEVCGGDRDCAVGTCEPGYENCDLLHKNGCEVDLRSSYDNCGRCGASCEDAGRSMPHASSAKCSAGRCVVGECLEGFGDCDGAASNGCEKPLPESACGRCDGCPGQTECDLTTRRCE